MPEQDPQDEALQARMRRLGINESELEESFIRGSGPGGQKINKTSSTVVLRHPTSGIEVRCQKERSQTRNRYWARMELSDRLEEARAHKAQAVKQAVEKERRRKRPRPRGLKESILRDKKKRGEVKRLRKPEW